MGDKKANSRLRNCVSCRRTFLDFHLLACLIEGFRISRQSDLIVSGWLKFGMPFGNQKNRQARSIVR
jgi:hypothetical protein